MTRKFTGWHMATTLVAFFGVVIAVNVVMAMEATRTFGGTVVDNSYVASQHFNTWLEEAKAQKQLGWKVAADTADRHAVVDAHSDGQALAGAVVTAVAEHPLGRLPDVTLKFHETAPGKYRADAALPSGRWRLRVHLTQGGHTADFIEDVAA